MMEYQSFDLGFACGVYFTVGIAFVTAGLTAGVWEIGLWLERRKRNANRIMV